MQREIIITEDGSHSIAVTDLNVSYHSIHGAIQESKHVFIQAGLNYLLNNSTCQPVRIFEMGLGTGLNVFLSAIEAERHPVKIHYTAVEQFPLSSEQASKLNYTKFLQHEKLFQKIHESDWNKDALLSASSILRKENVDFINYSDNNHFDLIYYDAFAPNAQPELWTKEMFDKLFNLVNPRGVLVTYCSKGDVRRAMIAAGFSVKKLSGPPGKREMLRAIKH